MEVIHASLQIDRNFGVRQVLPSYRPVDWLPRSFAAETLYPKTSYATWLLEHMLRWGHLDASVDLEAIAARAMVDRYFVEAAPHAVPATGTVTTVNDDHTKELEYVR